MRLGALASRFLRNFWERAQHELTRELDICGLEEIRLRVDRE